MTHASPIPSDHSAVAETDTPRVALDSHPSLQCDICGATTARASGKPFRKPSDVLRHKSCAHPGTLRSVPSHEDSAETGAARVVAVADEPIRKSANAPLRRRAHDAHFCPNCGLNLEVINAALTLLHNNE